MLRWLFPCHHSLELLVLICLPLQPKRKLPAIFCFSEKQFALKIRSSINSNESNHVNKLFTFLRLLYFILPILSFQVSNSQAIPCLHIFNSIILSLLFYDLNRTVITAYYLLGGYQVLINLITQMLLKYLCNYYKTYF